ncbi:uncharacterized protein LOC108735576 [Agrilus planipennis]|uniref:Uncharacterized protein LOC108735576 n=1 Tax=Agrilus planipennis TaxID=224129 RepID=A0A1W4WSR5_AGRPL|nr:uncharacterized protein LOC108735576 [Agrilus planipennis]
MLSYMIPTDEKPPPVPGKTHLHLTFGTYVNGNGTTGNNVISKENSVCSFASDATNTTASHSSMTPTSISDRSKSKLVANGTKHPPLKRVSFGSSKGSMVETLIYETPLQEEPEPSPIAENPTPFPADQEQTEAEREKVRVSFFQQSKPQEVDLPDDPLVYPDHEFIMAAAVQGDEANHLAYIRQESTDSGWDNPFRPGGDLSREADEIVQLIKGGKPITPPSGNAPSITQNNSTVLNNTSHYNSSEPITESPKKATALSSTPNAKSVNGNVKNDKHAPPESLDVQRGTTAPASDASQVEHVVIKKKQKCKCCVIQ